MNAEQLYEDAQELLEEGRTKEARDIGHQLLKMRFSGAFEILAMSFHGEGQLDIAIQVLENGVQDAPSVWLLWVQLGNYYSEAGKLQEALDAYDRAKSCPGCDLEQVSINEAILRLNAGNKDKGLEILEMLIKTTKDSELRLVALIHRLTTLIELDRVTEALMELGEAYLHDADNAALLTRMSEALLAKGDESNALNLAKQALGLKRAGDAAGVVRLIEGEASDECFIFGVMLKGRFEEEDSQMKFLKSTRVYADNSEEAVEMAIQFEPPDVQPDLKLEEVEQLDGPIADKKGVDWSSGLIFYNEEEKA